MSRRCPQHWAGETRRVLLLGDLNATTASLSAHPTEQRVKDDETTSGRRPALVRVCREEDYHIFIGLHRFGRGSARMTSHHTRIGEAVVVMRWATAGLSRTLWLWQ